MPDLCSLGKDNFSLILRKLTVFECGRLACVSRACRELVNDDDAIWKAYLLSEFGDANMKKENDNATFKDLYNAKTIARNLWTKAQNWRNHDNLELAEGVKEELLDELESDLGVTLPLDVKEVYKMHDGQDFPSNVREFDIDTVIQKSGIDTSGISYHPPSIVSDLWISTAMFLDLKNASECTIELRDHYNHMHKNLNSKKRRKLKKEKKRRGATDMDIIYSSIVYAQIGCDPLRQLLLLKCDTYDVYLWEYPLRLVQIHTKSKYGWFAIWLEGLTGFDENGNSCQVPLSWYLISEGKRDILIQSKRCKKLKKQITFECVDHYGFEIHPLLRIRLGFSICEFSTNDILHSNYRGIYRGPQLCSIASKISKPLICHVFSRFENKGKSPISGKNLSLWFISIRFESVETSEDLDIESSQETLQEMIITEERRRQEHSQWQNNALLKNKQRKRHFIKKSIPEQRNTCRAFSQQRSRYYK